MPIDIKKVQKKVEQLAEKADRSGIEKLAPEERLAVIAFSARGVISNGGLKYYFEGEVPLDTLVDAYRSLGLDAQADAAAASAALFPDPAIANDVAARQEYTGKLETRPFDKIFYKLSWDELIEAIGRYWEKGRAN
jgi:Xaa-Pro aminopeptidase